MSTGFLDTSGWFAALSPKEAKHRAAHATYRSWIESDTRLVTTNLVVAEMQIGIKRPDSHRLDIDRQRNLLDPRRRVVDGCLRHGRPRGREPG